MESGVTREERIEALRRACWQEAETAQQRREVAGRGQGVRYIPKEGAE